MSSPSPELTAVSAAASSPASTAVSEEESILSFLTTDFLESQNTALPFDGSQAFFDNLAAPTDSHDILKYEYEDLLHPPSPPTSNGTFSDTSGSPHQPMVDSCDEGSASDVPMESAAATSPAVTTANALEYWQYVYADLARQQEDQQKIATSTQPGAWPLLSLANPSDPSLITIQPKLPLLQPALAPNGAPASILSTIPGAAAASLVAQPSPLPPSPNASVKSEKTTSDKIVKKTNKRAKKNNSSNNGSAAPVGSSTALSPASSSPRPTPIAPGPPALAPAPVSLKPLLPLAPAPPSPPMTAQDAVPGGGKPLVPVSPAIQPSSGVRRPSIVPALTPSPARANPVLVKSTLVTEEKPQSEAALTAQAKRQERLIKNRAAALLSRKRKREHISLLESHTDQLKTENQELKEKVSELEENVKTLTSERDAARKEVDRLTRQVTILTSSHRLDTRMEVDLERNTRLSDSERVLNSKATGVVFMIILFSFALFTLPSRKLDTLMVGGSMERPRIGSSIVGRALDTYTKNPTIAGQVQEIKTTTQGENGDGNNTDLIVFSDKRVLQNWLGHRHLPAREAASTPGASADAVPKVVVSPPASSEGSATAMEIDGSETKSVGFVAQKHQAGPWDFAEDDLTEEPDRDALLYCANLLYSFRASTLVRPPGAARTKDGRVRRPRLSIYSPLDDVQDHHEGSASTSTSSSSSAGDLPPWMPKSTHDETNSKQQFLRLDVEVTSSRIVSGKNLMDHEQVIRYPLVPMGMFENKTSPVAEAPRVPVASPGKTDPSTPTLPSSSKTTAATADGDLPPSWQPRTRLRSLRSTRKSRVNERGGVTKTGPATGTAGGSTGAPRRMLYQRNNLVAQMAARAIEEKDLLDDMLPTIKEEPVEIFIKEEPID